MKRIILATLALSILAAPAAQAAQAGRSFGPDYAQSVSMKRGDHDRRYPSARHDDRRDVRKVAPKKHRWTRGERMPDWRRHAVPDWKRYHLRKPGHGQQWVRVGNDFLLVGIASGIIAALVAGR